MNHIVRFNPEFEAPTLDPGLSMDRTSQFWLAHMFDGLTGLDAQGRIQPRAAAEWNMSADGCVYDFYLRPDARWHDGSSVAAHDFEYSVRRIFLMPESETRFLFASLGLKGARKNAPGGLGIHALNDHHLRLELEAPNTHCLAIAASQAFFPVKKEQVEASAARFGSMSCVPIGNGPFAYSHGDGRTDFHLRRCSHHPDAASIRIDGISAPRITPRKMDTAEMYSSGELDIADKLDRDSYAKLILERKEKALFSFPSSVDFLFINHRPGRIFSNFKLRRALALSIDREKLVTTVEGGVPGTWPRSRLIPNYMPGVDAPFCEEYPLPSEPVDLSQSKALVQDYLQEQGLDCVPPFSVMASNDSERTRVADYMAALFSEVFATEVTSRPRSMKDRYAAEQAGDFDISITGWIPEYGDVSSSLTLFHSENEMNRGRYIDPRYDALIDRALLETSQKARMDLFAEAERRLIRQVAILPIYQFCFVYCETARYRGVVRRPFGGDPDLRFACEVRDGD